jgi:hypothetical protein
VKQPIIEELRALFNRDAGSTRLITFLSPTCGPCRYGQGVVRALFEEFPDETLTGFIIWVPMLPGDNEDTARAEQDRIADPRLHFWFDGDKAAASAWSTFIGLPSTTWDVYAIYDAAAHWPDGVPAPAPRIWMHQLNPTPATKPEDRLDAARLAREWLSLIGWNERSDGELSRKLHEKGRAVSVRPDAPR